MSDREAASHESADHIETAAPASDGDEDPPFFSDMWFASDRVQALANVLTIIVALAAIGLSVWEGRENRRHNRLSVLPHLESIEADISSTAPIDLDHFLLPTGMDSLYAVGYALRNSGLGPAVLEDVLVFEGGEDGLEAAPSNSVFRYLQAVRRDLAELPFDVSMLQQPHSQGAMLEAGEVHPFATVMVLFSAVDRDTIEARPASIVMEDAMERHSVVFCYCSVYGEDCDMTYLGAEPPVDDACGF